MEAPKVIWARPVGASKDWSDYTSGPWSMENPYGTSTRYIRADAPELVALVEMLSSLYDDLSLFNADEYDSGKIKNALSAWEALVNE